MSNVYSLVSDRFGMGTEAMEVLQEKAQRISVLSGFIARKVCEKQALNMSASEIQDTALITRVYLMQVLILFVKNSKRQLRL